MSDSDLTPVESAAGQLTDDELDGVSGGLLGYEVPGLVVPGATTSGCWENGVPTNCMFS